MLFATNLLVTACERYIARQRSLSEEEMAKQSEMGGLPETAAAFDDNWRFVCEHPNCKTRYVWYYRNERQSKWDTMVWLSQIQRVDSFADGTRPAITCPRALHGGAELPGYAHSRRVCQGSREAQAHPAGRRTETCLLDASVLALAHYQRDGSRYCCLVSPIQSAKHMQGLHMPVGEGSEGDRVQTVALL